MAMSRILALGALLLVLFGACSAGGGSSSSPGLAKLKLGVATDCATNPVCGQALKTAYNIDVTNATKLAACSRPMAQALLGNTIDVAELCSTQPDIAVNSWVVLADDKHTQPADNIAPLVRDDYLSKLADKAGFEKILNDVSAAMDTATLTGLNKQIVVDKQDIPVVAKGWLTSKNLLAGANASGPSARPDRPARRRMTPSPIWKAPMSCRKCWLYGSNLATASKNDWGETIPQTPSATNPAPPTIETTRGGV
jgi:hypothetical protein